MRRNARKLVGTRSYFLRDRKNVALPELPNELWKLILETLASEYTFAMLFCEDEPSIVHWLFTFGCVDRKFYRVCNEMIDSVWTNKTLPICDYWSDRILRKCVHVKSVSLSPDFRTVSGTSLANLTQLTYLDAPLDAIADNTLALTSLTALQSLKISECHRFSYCCLRSLTHLTDLDLSATAPHVIGDALLRLTNVTTLNMNHQWPSNCLEIASMTQLRRLRISYSNLPDEENIFSRLINLQMLDLYGTPLRGSYIRHLTNLRYLDIGYDETGIRWMHSSNLESLTELRIVGMAGVAGYSTCLFNRWHHLSYLYLNCIEDAQLETNLRAHPTLKHVSLNSLTCGQMRMDLPTIVPRLSSSHNPASDSGVELDILALMWSHRG